MPRLFAAAVVENSRASFGQARDGDASRPINMFDRARVLWLPNISVGADYFAHTGPQQNFAGDILKSNRSTFMAGFGPNVVFNFSDAVYAPLAARQDVRARQALEQTAINDVSFQVADAYFAVQQARGE
ncbi:MAG: TolC family protein, partial [Alphaproteobacteria bacterium]|nr:TolC family protein [Alphaproteobacteria bacterium]